MSCAMLNAMVLAMDGRASPVKLELRTMSIETWRCFLFVAMVDNIVMYLYLLYTYIMCISYR